MELAIELIRLRRLTLGGHKCRLGAALIRCINAVFAKAGGVSSTWQSRHAGLGEARYRLCMIHRSDLWLMIDIQSGNTPYRSILRLEIEKVGGRFDHPPAMLEEPLTV